MWRQSAGEVGWHDGGMEWPILIIAAVCAVTALVVALMVDRDSARSRRRVLQAPVDQPLLADTPAPTYFSPDQAKAKYDASARALTDEQRAAVSARLDGVAPVAVGWPSADFVTDPGSRWAVLESPTVLVAEAVGRLVDLADLIRPAADQCTAVVVVASQIPPDVMATLSLNAACGRLDCLCLITEELDQIAALVGATVLTAADVAAGYLPPAALGHCDLWVSDAKQTWIVPVPPA